jgi:GAF domain-containing protein
MTTATDYELLARQFGALSEGETDRLALSANFVALLNSAIEDINWLGLYIRRDNSLVLGPFQGLPACVHIPFGQGVCGTAAAEMRTLCVDDVHAFDGHIACDPASNSELVVPLVSAGRVVAVLDIDSPHHARFSAADQAGVERLCGDFVAVLESHDKPLDGFI